ncbi:hypothetical protein N0V88_005172 [Collariella sp. IMI 366227]|nr:hypothetical protein N0V88_005172 [Collariella sp. IMI 366227]
MRFTFAPERGSLAQRLERIAYDASDCRAALRGEKAPSNLGNEVARWCLVRGIRDHIDLARSLEVVELATFPGQEVISRARNARLIMSDEIPSQDAMSNEALYPYCIWHPNVAKEETYRRLFHLFPRMRYQVGRACAVAGYAQLYRELGLLPDVSIAEEARESRGKSNTGTQDIFNTIMAALMRYRVMDDYSRVIHLEKPQPLAFLRAETSVVATLAARRKYSNPFPHQDGFNITEDWGIGERTAQLKSPVLTAEEASLLYTPLPLDLPTMNKTLLILHAAATGSVDRYALLRRPWLLPLEHLCLVRGCYHSTAMATWLRTSPTLISSLNLTPKQHKMLLRAIHARCVMDGVISHLTSTTAPIPDDELPYWIWHPNSPPTSSPLASSRPAMRHQCARAAIAGLPRRIRHHHESPRRSPRTSSC